MSTDYARPLRTSNFRHCTATPRIAYTISTMSSNLPLRTIRIPALRNQCLHQQRRHVQSPRAFSTTSPQAFASSSPRLRGGSSLGQDRAITRAATRTMIGPAPKVNEIKAQEEGALSDDIGLLQDTVVRAPWGKLPGIWTPGFWGYMWKLIKSKGTALYSYVQIKTSIDYDRSKTTDELPRRILYKRCIYKTGWGRFTAIDAGNKRYIKDRAMNLYIQLYVNFAR
jgi:protein MBA1